MPLPPTRGSVTQAHIQLIPECVDASKSLLFLRRSGDGTTRRRESFASLEQVRGLHSRRECGLARLLGMRNGDCAEALALFFAPTRLPVSALRTTACGVLRL